MMELKKVIIEKGYTKLKVCKENGIEETYADSLNELLSLYGNPDNVIDQLNFEPIAPAPVKETSAPVVDNTTTANDKSATDVNKDKPEQSRFEPIQDLKNYVLQPGETVELVFNLNDKNIFLNTSIFSANVEWSNAFDTKVKLYKHQVRNNLNTFNEDYRLMLVEAPNSPIYLGQNFKVIFEVQNKKVQNQNSKLKLEVGITKDYTTNERELEVIDIVDNV